MDDLISRQAEIDELGYCQTYLFDSRDKDKKISLEDAEYAIEQLPSAQPEIIHCKDCRWYELPSHKISENCVRWMKSNGILLPIKPDDFCSRAERRTDEGD